MMYDIYIYSRVWILLLVSKYRTINWKMGGLCYCIWDNYATCIYLYRKWNLCIPSHSSIHNLKVINSVEICCDATLASVWQYSGFICFRWDSLQKHSFGNLCIFYMSKVRRILIFGTYWHWSFSKCSDFQEADFFTFLLGLKLKTLQFVTMKCNLNISCNFVTQSELC